MKFLHPISPLLLVLIFAACALGEDNSSTAGRGSFVTLKQSTGSEFRAFVAGPTDARAAVLIVHDYFGISDATKQSALRLGALGDTARLPSISMEANQQLAMRKSVKLMQSVDRKTTDQLLQTGLDYLRQPGREVATIGFSMGGQESFNASLNDPEAVSATAMIYGSGLDKIET